MTQARDKRGQGRGGTVKLSDIRQQRMLTQREVAERAGLTITTLSRLENQHSVPTFRTIRALAEVFGMSPQELRQTIAAN